MKMFRNTVVIFLSVVLMFLASVGLFTALEYQRGNPALPASQPIAAPSLPSVGDTIHYLLKRTCAHCTPDASRGSPNNTSERWLLIGSNAKVRKLYSRVTNEQGQLVSEAFMDADAKRFYQYWNLRDELWVEPEMFEHDVLSWSVKSIDEELTSKGFAATREVAMAGGQASVMEQRSPSDQLPTEWTTLLPIGFQAKQYVRRVFISRRPFVGFPLGVETVITSADGKEFALDSEKVVEWQVMSPTQIPANLFEWQPPQAKTIRDATKAR